MKLYLIAIDDTNPDAMRSSHNPTRHYLYREPGETNSSHEPREEGWLGNTGGINREALGAISLDEPDWQGALASLLPDDADINADAIRRWADADPAADGLDEHGDSAGLQIPASTCRGTRSCTWDEGDDDGEGGEYPEPRAGYQFIAGEDSASNIEPLDADEETALYEAAPSDVDSVCATTETILDAAGVWCERISHETYNAGTNGTDWDYVAISDDDEDAANTALHAAAALAKLEIQWPTILAMLEHLRPANPADKVPA